MPSTKTVPVTVFSYAVQFFLLIVFTVAADWILHTAGLVWIGRYFGIAGTALILASLTYSLRKRKIIQGGKPKMLLALHEYGSWIGSWLILVHAGIHLNALLPWLAVAAMLVNVASGLTGKYLLKKSQMILVDRKKLLTEAGVEGNEVEKQVFLDSLAVDIMKRWRVVHMPITLTFGLLALAHIILVLMYMGRF